MLTASQLFDLCKARAKKLATHTGPEGGRYYISDSGKKVYVEKEVGIRVAPGPIDQRLQGQMHISPEPHMINWPTSRTHVKIAQMHWPAYVCRSCHHPVVPKHTAPVLTGIHSATHGVGPAKIEASDEGPGGYIAVPEKVGETVRVRILDPSTKKIRTEYGWKPEWVASRLCDRCFEKKAPAYEARQEKKEARKVKEHVKSEVKRHREKLILKRKSARAEKRIKEKAERVAGRKTKVKKSAALWLAP